MTDDVFGVQTAQLAAVLAKPACQYFAVNPLTGTRLASNVSAHRNFLIEFDTGTIDEQRAIIVNSQLPATTVTFSGSKSLHVVIALSHEIDADEWTGTSEMLRFIFRSSDKKVKDAARLTRLAGAMNQRTGVTQELVFLDSRVSPRRLAGWLSHHWPRYQRYLDDQKRKQEERANRAASGTPREATLATLEGRLLSDRFSRHDILVMAAADLVACGWEYSAVLEAIEGAADLLGVSADGARSREAYNIVNWAFKKVGV